jgi:hypothetical protein
MSDPVQQHVERAMALLDDIGAVDVEHPSGTLAGHLRGTYDLLASWSCSDETCLAGLYHSVYGTEFFRTETLALDARERVKAAIGDPAEQLTFLFCVMRRSSLYENLDRGAPYSVEDREGGQHPLDGVGQFAALMALDVANRLEQLERSPLSATQRARDRDIYERAVPLLPAPAISAMREALEEMSKPEQLARRAFRRIRRGLRGSGR